MEISESACIIYPLQYTGKCRKNVPTGESKPSIEFLFVFKSRCCVRKTKEKFNLHK